MNFIYLTCPNKIEAKKIAREILRKKLAVCGNIFPIESLYWWKGRIENEREAVLILKTKENNFKKIEKEIKKLHSYKTPFIGSIKIDEVNQGYLNYLKKEIK